MWRISSRMLMTGSLLFGVIGIGLSGRAQDEADPGGEPPAKQARPRAVFMTDEQFDEWFFGPLGGAEKAAARFESQLTAKIGELDRMYGLTPEQKKKLEVAGKRDIRRLFDSIREKKVILDRVGRNVGELRAVVRELQAFQRTFTREFPFGGGSLLAKTLKKNLIAEQYSRYNKEFYRSRVEQVVSSSDMGHRLGNEQHRRFVNLIVEETPPLKQYGEYDAHAVMFQASKLPEDKLRPDPRRRPVAPAT